MDQPGEITILLQRWRDGEDDALDPLFALIYPQLHFIAGSLMRLERPGHILQPTGIVNEFYVKLIQQQRLSFDDRAHFFSLAAGFMRRILVDQARKTGTRKRAGGTRVVLSDDLRWVSQAGAEILDVNQALEELWTLDERKCRMIELRYFLGFTSEETAEILKTSKATVDRELKFARGWIQERLT